ncbi:MAG: uncharacterized protein QOE08_405 [Thermoleophilaceae bacterium]|jgi:uncharacterized protein (TIGR01777 family)|nr:uncharacterized protein [Thermoleophilaceae bacterium]
MKVAVTGATGMIGGEVVKALLGRGDDVVVLSRDAARAYEKLGQEVEAHTWEDPVSEPAPAAALSGADGVINLLGEPIDQRWSDKAKRAIRESRELGTRNLLAGLRQAEPRPRVLVSGSAIGFYGPRGDEPLDESAPPAAGDFLSEIVQAWEREALRAEELGMRVVLTRTGVVLSPSGGALSKMLPPFKMGVGGPVAGGKQYVPWVHSDDVVGALLFALDTEAASGPLNVTAPEPVTNAELSKALGRVLHRPALAPVPALAIKALYGEMGSIVTSGARVMPTRLEQLGYEFREPELEHALRRATGK